ncbi:transcriptional regulator, PadR family [Lachnospiraceae bacterium KM106-2]|nr:transcriptional regulator, PadR family [Lachnospiraceae bacterium KM106-2]
MIRALILYYLNIKPTHGYEIQRFLQLTGTDQWTKIQSGSIYYALTKLEKEENIIVEREERTGSRIRKIYKITEKGKKTLIEEMAHELMEPICNVGSMKFITSPIIDSLSKEQMKSLLDQHIEQLNEQLTYWEQWQSAKAGDQATRLTQLSFQMTIDSLKNQILWHEELREHLDQYIEESKIMAETIKMFNADQFESEKRADEKTQNLAYAEELLEKMKNDPKKAMESLNTIIKELKKKE